MRNSFLILNLIAITFCQGCSSQQGKRFRTISEWHTLPQEYVMVAAHRGDWRNAPENSLQAVQNCIDMGVDIVEIDVQKTKDSHLILLHDKKLDRTTTGKGFVSDWTLDSLRTLRLRNGYGLETDHPIPTLEEVLKLARNKIIVFIDKGYDHLTEAYELLKSTNMLEQAFFEGHQTFSQLRTDYSDIFKNIYYAPRISKNTQDIESYTREFLQEKNYPVFISAFETEDSNVLNQFELIRQHDARVMATTLWGKACAGHTDDVSVKDPESGWGWVIMKGANVICTDRPALLIEYLRNKGIHP